MDIFNLYDKRSWLKDAKCGQPGKNPDDWNSKTVQGGNSTPPDQRKRALNLCHGCPVMLECAQEALDEHDVVGYFPSGVVRAGVEIRGTVTGPGTWKPFKRGLEEIVENGGYSEHQEWLVKEHRREIGIEYMEENK